MIERLFTGIFDTGTASIVDVSDFLLCIAFGLVVGIILAAAYTYKTKYTNSFVVTLALLPAVVSVVIIMVNGNIGAGIAVAGAFSLVRFRSAQGTAKEICAIFLAMGTGLVVGMGYLGYAVLCAVIFGAVLMIYSSLDFGSKKKEAKYRTLSITIPEDLDYTGVFDDIFGEYTSECELLRVKTTNMGSLFRLTYNLTMKDETKEKEMIDKLRCRNGNLEISVARQETAAAEL